jgi:hypothetical protein
MGLSSFFRRGGRERDRARTSGLPAGMVDTNYSSTPSRYWFEIRGEASYQPTLRKLSAGRRQRGEDVTFRVFFWPEPGNHYDSNAVAVYVGGLGVIGYVPREHAAEIQPSVLKLWNHHQIASCDGKLFGGGPDKPTLGVWLSLDADALVGHRYGTQQ